MVAPGSPPRPTNNGQQLLLAFGILLAFAIVIGLILIGAQWLGTSQSAATATPPPTASLPPAPASPTPAATATPPPPTASSLPPTATPPPTPVPTFEPLRPFTPTLAPVPTRPIIATKPAGPTPAEQQYIGQIRQQALLYPPIFSRLETLLKNVQLTESWGNQVQQELVKLREIDAQSMRLAAPSARFQPIHGQWREVTTDLSLASYDIENGLKQILGGNPERGLGTANDGFERVSRSTPKIRAIGAQIDAIERGQ
jgi:hypothetical protein